MRLQLVTQIRLIVILSTPITESFQRQIGKYFQLTNSPIKKNVSMMQLLEKAIWVKNNNLKMHHRSHTGERDTLIVALYLNGGFSLVRTLEF